MACFARTALAAALQVCRGPDTGVLLPTHLKGIIQEVASTDGHHQRREVAVSIDCVAVEGRVQQDHAGQGDLRGRDEGVEVPR